MNLRPIFKRLLKFCWMSCPWSWVRMERGHWQLVMVETVLFLTILPVRLSCLCRSVFNRRSAPRWSALRWKANT